MDNDWTIFDVAVCPAGRDERPLKVDEFLHLPVRVTVRFVIRQRCARFAARLSLNQKSMAIKLIRCKRNPLCRRSRCGSCRGRTFGMVAKMMTKTITLCVRCRLAAGADGRRWYDEVSNMIASTAKAGRMMIENVVPSPDR